MSLVRFLETATKPLLKRGGFFSIMETKQELRKLMLQILKTSKGPSPEVVEKKISGLEVYKNADIVVAYCPLKSEIDVTQLIDKAILDGKIVLLPDENPGTFREAKADWKAHLIKLKNNTCTVDTNKILSIVESNATILVLVPGLAFTEDGARLGRGAGYYDQFLMETSGRKITTIGLCRKTQLVGEVPQQPHDQCVNMVIAF